MALGSINSRLAAHDARLDEMAGPEELPLAADEQQPGISQATTETGGVFDGMEEAVRRNIADRLRGTRPVYATQVDEEDATSPQHKKHHKAVSGRLRTADNTVVKQITWPYELIYTQAWPASQQYIRTYCACRS